LLKLEKVGNREAVAIETRFGDPESFYKAVENSHGQLVDEPWYSYSDGEELLQELEQAGFKPSEDSPGYPETIDTRGAEYRLLGVDEEQGHHHYYRFTPSHAEVLLLSTDEDGDLVEDDRWRLNHSDPKTRLREYQYQHPWKEIGEIVDHGYRSLTEPRFYPHRNEPLGGSLLLDDERYVLPFRAPVSTAADILEAETKEADDVFIDYRPDFLELAPADATEKYQLVPELRGDNEVSGTRIIDQVLRLDKGSEQVIDSFQLDELARDHFIQCLENIPEFDEETAEVWIDQYGNLRTASWAISHDTEHVENQWGFDPEELFKQFGEADVYRNGDSPEAGTLNFPERRANELTEADQEQYFDEVVQPQTDEDVEDTESGDQVGLSDF
jgi:hypothetical protein